MDKARAKDFYRQLRKELVLTCISDFPSPETCGKVHASEQAASNHAERLEALRLKRARGKKVENPNIYRSSWRLSWVSPSYLGLAVGSQPEDEPEEAEVAEACEPTETEPNSSPTLF